MSNERKNWMTWGIGAPSELHKSECRSITWAQLLFDPSGPLCQGLSKAKPRLTLWRVLYERSKRKGWKNLKIDCSSEGMLTLEKSVSKQTTIENHDVTSLRHDIPQCKAKAKTKPIPQHHSRRHQARRH